MLSFAGAAAARQVVEISFQPDRGAVYAVHEERTRTIVREQQTGPAITAVVNATLELLGPNAEGWDARWTTDAVEGGDAVIDGGTPVSGFLVGVPVLLSLDEAGAPNGLSDWPRLRATIIRAIRESMPAAERDESWLRMIEANEAWFSTWSPAEAAQGLMPQIGVMSLCQQTGLAIGELRRSEELVHNPFGGALIPAHATVELISVDRGAGIANLIRTSELDPDAAALAQRETIERLAQTTGRSADEVAAQFGAHPTREVRAECVVDLATGVTRSVSYRLSVVVAGELSVDRRDITFSLR